MILKNKYYNDIYAHEMLKANYHTHTKRCKHAEGEDREYIEVAIKAGFKVLGFSDHTPYPFPDNYISPMRMEMVDLEDYVESIIKLKKEYENEILILLGLETDYFPEYFILLMEKIKKYPFDYMILGQHYFNNELNRKHVRKPRNEYIYIEEYVNQIIEGIHTGYFDYLAHPDIINFTGPEDIYTTNMRKLAMEMKRLNIPLEINVNGYRDKCNYPNPRFIDIAIEVGNDFIIGVDAHSPKELLDRKSYENCIQLVKQRGGYLLSAQ